MNKDKKEDIKSICICSNCGNTFYVIQEIIETAHCPACLSPVLDDTQNDAVIEDPELIKDQELINDIEKLEELEKHTHRGYN
jgi:predicted amidophosphoribosyltransferase